MPDTTVNPQPEPALPQPPLVPSGELSESVPVSDTPETQPEPARLSPQQAEDVRQYVRLEVNKGTPRADLIIELKAGAARAGIVISDEEAAAFYEQAKRDADAKLKSRTHDQLKKQVADAPGDLVEGLIPERSVNIGIGDSGLGKTPLLVQLGLCVAAGIPFLDQPCRKGKVLYVDYENGVAGFDRLLDKLCTHLKLEKAPDTFRVLHQPATIKDVYAEIQEFQPDLVIIDAGRGFDSSMEEKNSAAGNRIAELEKIAAKGPAFLIQHHIRKDDPKNRPPALANTDVMDWLQRASGARALINQTSVRLAIDAHNDGEAELMIKGHYKLTGPFGPILIGRNRDEDGEPIGYRRLSGVALLPKDQRDCYAGLPSEFGFSELQRISGQGPKVVAQWLLGWIAAGVVKKHGANRSRTKYHKLAA